ncbi:MAG: hypothetical protein RMM31_10930 [Anaerolineae bacterium]|nr:hypothetical protein [Thermoflexales bacterium]MDW8396743.1 hypothetical protein [Anaerolineae bacterium]
MYEQLPQLASQSGFPPPIPTKPSAINVVAALALASGITNVLGSITLVALSLLGVVATIGFGAVLSCLCIPLSIPLFILGVFEIVYATRLFGLPHSGARLSAAIAVLEIVAILYLNFISLASGVVALVVRGNPEVERYFAYLDALEYQQDVYARRAL